MTLPTLRNWGLLQPGSRLLILSRVDLTCGIALPQCLQRLVAPRTHLTREQAAHCPDHQQDNRYPEEDHQAHAYEPATAIHSKTIHHIRSSFRNTVRKRTIRFSHPYRGAGRCTTFVFPCV